MPEDCQHLTRVNEISGVNERINELSAITSRDLEDTVYFLEYIRGLWTEKTLSTDTVRCS